MDNEWMSLFMGIVKKRFHYSGISADVVTTLLLEMAKHGLLTDDDVYKGGMDLFKRYIKADYE